jgi:hypothetical protein
MAWSLVYQKVVNSDKMKGSTMVWTQAAETVDHLVFQKESQKVVKLVISLVKMMVEMMAVQ